MAEIDYTPITRKIEYMLKEKIRTEGLVKSGKLYDSISVKYESGVFKIEAEDYFKYLDEEHKISQSVFNSQELADFIAYEISRQMENQI